MDKIGISELSIDHVKVSTVCNVRNLRTWFDNHLSMKTAINKTCQSGLYHLHDIGCIKIFLSYEDGNSIVQAIVMTRIEYCNSLLYGTNLSKLQWMHTRQSDWCAHCQNMNKSHCHLYVFTGCRLSLESISRLLYALFQVHSWTRPQLFKKYGRHQEDFDIKPPLKHQYPVGRPFTTIEKNAW